MKKNIIILALLGSCTFVSAQQNPQFSQYFDNTVSVNPAYAGSSGMLNITGIHREQWLGFTGRPQASSISMNTPLNYESVGVGVSMVNFTAGPLTQNMIYGDFSYTLKFRNPNCKLAFGVKGGVNLISMNVNDIITTNPNDPKFSQNITNHASPNFGFGVYYHTPKFFAGISTPKLLEKSYGGVSTTDLEKRHYFMIMGGVFNLNKNLKLRPTTQLKLTNGAPISLDINAAFIYKNKFWIGPLYRLNSSLGAFVQFQMTQQFKLGLASDFSTTAIRNFNSGTFELMASYDFTYKKKGIVSPRYF